jgi:hypothetical protein
MSESEWTQMLLKHGCAELADSDPHRKPLEPTPVVSQAAEPPPAEGFPRTCT